MRRAAARRADLLEPLTIAKPGECAVAVHIDPAVIAHASGDPGLPVLAALLGASIAALADFFLALVSNLQTRGFADLAQAPGGDANVSQRRLAPPYAGCVLFAQGTSSLPRRSLLPVGVFTLSRDVNVLPLVIAAVAVAHITRGRIAPALPRAVAADRRR